MHNRNLPRITAPKSKGVYIPYTRKFLFFFRDFGVSLEDAGCAALSKLSRTSPIPWLNALAASWVFSSSPPQPLNPQALHIFFTRTHKVSPWVMLRQFQSWASWVFEPKRGGQLESSALRNFVASCPRQFALSLPRHRYYKAE